MSLESITIFTDGSSRGNPGPGGFAAIVVYRGDSRNSAERTRNYAEVTELGGREDHTTNNRMELRAAIEALAFIHKSKITNPKSIFIYADSSYLINGITKWIHGWQKNGWKTKAKKGVENRDLWKQLVKLITIYRNCDWKLVEGHAGVAGNQRCDEIATAFADGKKPQLYAGVLENYSIKNILDVSRGLTSHRERGQTSTARKRSRATAYSYVSAVGGAVETHKTWAECEKRVKGKQARYKKALSPEEEKELIQEWGVK